MNISSNLLVLAEADTIAVSAAGLDKGAAVGNGVVASARIPRGHKVAIKLMKAGGPVLKFGQIIGFANADIAPGDWVHDHNIGMGAFSGAGLPPRDVPLVDFVAEAGRATFEGYRRASGKTGTRNYIGILTSVNCSASVATFIADAFNRSDILDDYPNVDGVMPLVHGTGCGMAARGEGFDALARTQWGYAGNPNFAAILLVGLGCEVFQIGRMKEIYGIVEGETFQSMTIQESGGTRKTVERGVARIREMLPIAGKATRETVPATDLMLALQCGGSDGYSGITANPALGVAADMLVRHGGTAILSETPEIYGAEHLLTRRAASAEVAEKLMRRIAWWEDYTARNGGEMNNNPSPGNKAGGLSTILEKSLGAVAKGGSTPLNAVYEYAEPVTTKGFVYMDTPGYDPVSATGQVAGGANVICFTTGRGSAFGCKPTPSIKLATNSRVYETMREDMDINCGDVLDGVPLEEKGREIFETILRVASGERTKSEELGYGGNEFVPWQIGAVM